MADLNAIDRSPLREEITSTNVFEAIQGADPTIPPPDTDVITALRNQAEDNVPSLGSPVSTCSVLDSLSVFSDIGVEGSRVPQFTDDVGILNISDSPINASHRLTSLVQCYHSLCHTVDNLRDGINKEAEAVNANALAKVEHAKMQLEASREKARAIVEGMRIPSNASIYARLPWLLSKDRLVSLVHGRPPKITEAEPSSTIKPLSVVPPGASITLPWQHGVEKEAHASERKSYSPTFPPITVIPAIPVPAPQSPVPSSPKKEEIIYDLCWQSAGLAAIHSAPFATPSSNDTLEVQMDRYHRRFKYYERAITIAKSVDVGTLLIPDIPWPVLTPPTGEFPILCHHPLLNEGVLLDSMREFICSYAEWKPMPFNEVTRVMHYDWLILESKLNSKRKKEGWS